MCNNIASKHERGLNVIDEFIRNGVLLIAIEIRVVFVLGLRYYHRIFIRILRFTFFYS